MQRWCVAAFWRTLGPLAQATQDKARFSIGTSSPQLSCASRSTILILQEKRPNPGALLRNPQGTRAGPLWGTQSWSHREPRSTGLLSTPSPSPSQTKAAASKPQLMKPADESGELTLGLQAPHTSSSTTEDASGLFSSSASDPCKHHLILL